MISLEKGQRISLEKNGSGLNEVCVGVNWGAIEKKGFFGGVKKEAVDLDASVGAFDANKQLSAVVYFGDLKAFNGAISHSGDDRTGDMDGDDGLDNEIITIKMNTLPATVDKVAIVLNSFGGHDFKTIPFASIRLYEGTPTRVDNVIANYNIANDAKFNGSVAMVLGIMYRHNNGWKFRAVGEPTADRELKGTLQTVAELYL
ncbi:TerD family protein [Shewanella sp. VB17]|uniref:TerD family protein n=1 Tax=Shewanella sp. VB17 TaxID=2739432 RepID=UPI0015655FFA|nr:TerD family protein [Shewanella sp. VB17]NRD72871.1 TerD family protein [Shewanella sp. VB17]